FGVAVLGSAAFLAGRVALPAGNRDNRAEVMALSMSLGLGILSHLVLLLGILDKIFWWTTCIGFLLWVGVITYLRRSTLFTSRSVRGQANTDLIPIAILVVMVIAPLFLIALYPPTAWDATEYYLASARVFVLKHGLIPTPFLRVITYTHFTQ